MPLLQLPAELLLLILNHVGREFFAQDPRRLAVSKQWHDLAWPVLVRDLRLTTASLVRFTADPALLARSQRHITTVTLHFQGPSLPATNVAAFRRAIPADTAWSAQLTTSLTTLAATLSHRVPALDVFAFDAVAQRRVQLWSMEKGWDAEGDPEVEEEDVEEDLAEMYESDLDH